MSATGPPVTVLFARRADFKLNSRSTLNILSIIAAPNVDFDPLCYTHEKTETEETISDSRLSGVFENIPAQVRVGLKLYLLFAATHSRACA